MCVGGRFLGHHYASHPILRKRVHPRGRKEEVDDGGVATVSRTMQWCRTMLQGQTRRGASKGVPRGEGRRKERTDPLVDQQRLSTPGGLSPASRSTGNLRYPVPLSPNTRLSKAQYDPSRSLLTVLAVAGLAPAARSVRRTSR